MYNKIMPFITEGKTNYLYISFVAALAIIAGGLILGYYYFWIIELEARLVEIEAQLPIVKSSGNEFTNSEKTFNLVLPLGWANTSTEGGVGDSYQKYTFKGSE